VRLQEVSGYLYVTLWDKQYKRPRRFYLGRSSDPRLAELLKAAVELRIPEEEVEDYLARQVDPGLRMTKPRAGCLLGGPGCPVLSVERRFKSALRLAVRVVRKFFPEYAVVGRFARNFYAPPETTA